MLRAIDIVRRVAPRARPDYLAAIEAGDDDLVDIGGIDNVARLDHFLAQVLHESGGLTITTESMRYTAARIRAVWPSRPEAVKFAGDPAGLAECVYGGRMGNGPAGSGDGARYIGRGLLQITGRESYEHYGRMLGVDLVGSPDLAVAPEWALKIAAAEWAASSRRGRSCNEMADRDDIEGITLAINGGRTGLAERVAWLRKVRAARAALTGTAKPLTSSRTMGGLGIASLGVAGNEGADQLGDGLSSLADQLAPAALASDRIATIIGLLKASAAILAAAGIVWAAWARWDDAGRPLPRIAPDWLARLVGGHKPEAE